MKSKTVQTRINFYTNIVTLGINAVIAIIYTPYLVNKLGVAAYGILPLALIVNQYIDVAAGALTSAYTRFYSVAIQKSDYNQASKVISTSILAIGAIVLCSLPIFIGIIINVDTVFQIPDGLTVSAQILFVYTALSFILSLITSTLNVTLYAQNRLDLMNFLKIIRSIMKFVIVWLLFEFASVNVAFVGLSGFITEIIVLIFSLLIFYKTRPDCIRISIKVFDKAILFAIIAMSVWVLIQQLGDTLLYRTDNLLFNVYLGAEASGRLGAISSFGGYVMQITSVLGALFGPLILMAYSTENHEEVKYLAMSQSKIVGILSAILCGVIAGVGGPLLSIWLDHSFVDYDNWLLIKLLPMPFYAAGGILAYVYRAWNRVKLPAIITIAIGVIDIVVIVLLCNIFQVQHANIILFTSALFSIAQCYIMNVYCVDRIYHGLWKKGMRTFLIILVVAFISYMLSKVVGYFWKADNLLILLTQLLLDALIALGILVYVFFNKQERSLLLSLIK